MNINTDNIIDLNTIRQYKEDKTIRFCTCGSILKTKEEKDIEICFNCLEYVLECFHNGEIEKDNPLYDILTKTVNNVAENNRD